MTLTSLDTLLSDAISAADPDLSERMESDPQAHLDLVALTSKAHHRTADMLRESVLSARNAGQSWETIGETLGISRQAAQQRFGDQKGGVDTGSGPERRRLEGLTAFNEMASLEKAGRYGWHSVAYGPLFHIVERDTVQWEHRRVLAWSRRSDELAADGWRAVGSGWFPWTYYARPIDVPALPGDFAMEETPGE